MPAEFTRAIERRDAAFDGRFVFAVKTTGIYCRPSCPSRRPKPENVVLFSTPVEAEAAGFRPCLRCKPTTPPRIAPSRDSRTAARRQQFRQSLRKGADVTTALYDAGYSSPSRVYENASEWLGMTPAQYGKGGAGLAIRYAAVHCSLGRLLVAATDRGICSVTLGASDRELIAALHEEFHAADLTRDQDSLGAWAEDIAQSLGSSPKSRALPLDIRATEFQMKVWRALRAIPRGETRSYSQLAREIGSPAAARAVARACASNKAALLIPCHRVIREDGALSGYRWGVERKRKVLAAEQDAQPAFPRP